jgi:hypothetical protein
MMNPTLDYIITEIKSKIDILAVVEESNLQLRKRGRSYMGLCPFHTEKSPSFSVNPQKNIYKCFGCGVGGDQIKLYAQLHGMENKHAIALLARRIGILGKQKLSNVQQIEISKRFEDKQLEKKFYIEIKRLFFSLCDIRDLLVARGRMSADIDQLEQDDLYTNFCTKRHDFSRSIDGLVESLFDEIAFDLQMDCFENARGVEEKWARLLEERKLNIFENEE